MRFGLLHEAGEFVFDFAGCIGGVVVCPDVLLRERHVEAGLHDRRGDGACGIELGKTACRRRSVFERWILRVCGCSGDCGEDDKASEPQCELLHADTSVFLIEIVSPYNQSRLELAMLLL